MDVIVLSCLAMSGRRTCQQGGMQDIVCHGRGQEEGEMPNRGIVSLPWHWHVIDKLS